MARARNGRLVKSAKPKRWPRKSPAGSNPALEAAAYAEAEKAIAEARSSGATELIIRNQYLQILPSSLASLSSLQRLRLENTAVFALDALEGLTALQTLSLAGSRVADIRPLASLTALQTLFLDNTPVANLGPLAGLSGLQDLWLTGTDVADCTSLAGLSRLQTLSLAGTRVTDFAPLSGLTELQVLVLDSTAIADLAPLSRLTNLQDLWLENTAAAELDPIANFTDLRALSIAGTGVSDLAPLKALSAIQTLSLAGTRVTDLSPLAGLKTLRTLRLAGTNVADVNPIGGLTALETLTLDGTRIANLAPLSGLISLCDSATSNRQDDPEVGLSFANSAATNLGLLDHLATLDNPARTVETINYLRRQQGLDEYWPEGYDRPAEIIEFWKGFEAKGSPKPSQPADNKVPTVPSKRPAAIDPVWLDGKLSIRMHPITGELGPNALVAALAALRRQIGRLADETDSVPNGDKRFVTYLRNLTAMIPETTPRQDELFDLAHEHEMLLAYTKTVGDQWPDVIAARFHAMRLAFERTMRQFPNWREFQDAYENTKSSLPPTVTADADTVASALESELQKDEAPGFVAPEISNILRRLRERLTVTQIDHAEAQIEAGKQELAADILESANNVLKAIAEIALAGWSKTAGARKVTSEAASEYRKGFGKGLKKAAKEQGPRDGASVFKWLRRLVVGSAGAAVAGATGVGGKAVGWLDLLITKYPQSFEWLSSVAQFLKNLM